VAPVLGNLEGHDDEVAEPDGDLLRAAGAEIGLARLEGVDERDFEVLVRRAVYPSAAHSTRRMTTTKAAMTNR
jgi:hypothetical protein